MPRDKKYAAQKKGPASAMQSPAAAERGVRPPTLTPPTVSSELSRLIDWATTSQIPEAEEDIGRAAGRLPVIGPAAEPVARILTSGGTSPLGMALGGLGAVSALRAGARNVGLLKPKAVAPVVERYMPNVSAYEEAAPTALRATSHIPYGPLETLGRTPPPGAQISRGSASSLNQVLEDILSQVRGSRSADDLAEAVTAPPRANPVATADSIESRVRAALQQRGMPIADRAPYTGAAAEVGHPGAVQYMEREYAANHPIARRILGDRVKPDVPTRLSKTKGPALEETIQKALQDLQVGERRVGAGPSLRPSGPRVSPRAGGYLSPGEERGINELDDLMESIHGMTPDAPSVQFPGKQGLYTEPSLPASRAAIEPMKAPLFGTHKGVTANIHAGEADRLLDAGDYDGAATEISRALGSFFGGKGSSRGAISRELLVRSGGGALGAGIGGTQGDTTEERVKNAALGAATGAFLVPNVARMVASTFPKAAQSYIYTSTLSSPGSVMKAWLGAYSGAATAALENPKAAPAIVRELMPDRFTPRFLAAFRTTDVGGQQISKEAPNILKRIYGAADVAARAAMKAGGISEADAARYTLSGMPTTAMGKDTLGFLERQGLPVKLLTSLFPRVGIQILERGAERMGGGLIAPSLRTSGNQLAKTALGAGAAATAYQHEPDIPDWLKPFAIAATGPYALPVSVGMAVRKGKEKKGSIGEGLQEAGRTVAGQIPLSTFGTYEAGRRVGSGASLVPNIVQDVAEYRDKYDRVPEGFFGGTKAKIPGLRETLPIRSARVNISGTPTDEGRSKSPLKRALTPSTRETEPTKGIDPDVVSELKRLEININPPSYEKNIKVGSKTIAVPPELASRRQAESRSRLVPQIKRLMDSPRYRSMDDDRRKTVMEKLIQQTMNAGSAKARGIVLKELKELVQK